MRPTIWLVMLSACGGSSDGVSTGNFPSAIAEVTCGKLAECCTTEELMDETLGSEDEAECKLVFTGFGGLLADIIDDSIAAGRLIYHADRVETCLDVIAGLSCTEYKTEADLENGPCEDPFEGLVDLGGACAQDFDCISNYCSGDSLDFEGNVTFGVCTDPPIAGTPCDDGRCTDEAFCDRSGETDICVARLGDGAACTGDNQCISDHCDVTCIAPTCDGL